jgi:hypothetical protein
MSGLYRVVYVILTYTVDPFLFGCSFLKARPAARHVGIGVLNLVGKFIICSGTTFLSS